MTELPRPKPSRFASGAAQKLPLSGGDWVLVHTELSYAQQKRLAGAGLSGVPAALAEHGEGERLSIDLAEFEIEKLVTWVLDWSFTDEDGQHVVVSRQTIEGLTVDTAEEIQAALGEFIAERDAAKKGLGGSRPSGPTSPSAPASGGPGTS